MKICLAGEGAMGTNHMQAMRGIEGVEVVTLAGGIEEDAAAFAKQWEISHCSLSLEECLNQPGVEAVILATPSQVHATQAIQALRMGKHVLVEIPMALNLEDSERLVAEAEKSGLVCMVNHSFRYSAPFREVYRRVQQEEMLHLHHVIAQTYFFRRTNVNMYGKPRTWTDNLLWHHACHMVDFVSWLLDDPDLDVRGQAGPGHPRLGIPMDLTVGMRSKDGTLVSGVLSFNNHGPTTVTYRLIGEEDTLILERGALTDKDGNPVPLEGEPYESPAKEFIDAIREGREPLTSVQTCLPTMRLLDKIQRSIDDKG